MLRFNLSTIKRRPYILRKSHNIQWNDFPEKFKKKARKFIRDEIYIIDGSCKAKVFYDDRRLWDYKFASVYRVEFYNVDNIWVGNSYIGIFDDGTIEYDPLN